LFVLAVVSALAAAVILSSVVQVGSSLVNAHQPIPVNRAAFPSLATLVAPHHFRGFSAFNFSSRLLPVPPEIVKIITSLGPAEIASLASHHGLLSEPHSAALQASGITGADLLG
jgi:hypothetical protein